MKHYISKKYVKNISSEDIQNYLISQRTHLKDATIRKHYILLKSIFTSLFRENIIEKNIFSDIEIPKENKYIIDESNIYSKKEIVKLLDLIKGTELELPIKLSLFLGLRRGEIVGLKWKNVFLEESYLYICNNITRVGKITSEKRPKSNSSIRKIGFDEYIKKLLIIQSEKQRELSNNGKTHFEYVLSNNDGSNVNPDRISKKFYNIISKYNLRKIRFHDLRHTFASIANATGMTIYDISKVLGHSDVTVTSKVYIHLLEDTHKNVITAVSKYIRD